MLPRLPPASAPCRQLISGNEPSIPGESGGRRPGGARLRLGPPRRPPGGEGSQKTGGHDLGADGLGLARRAGRGLRCGGRLGLARRAGRGLRGARAGDWPVNSHPSLRTTGPGRAAAGGPAHIISGSDNADRHGDSEETCRLLSMMMLDAIGNIGNGSGSQILVNSLGRIENLGYRDCT